MAATKKSERLWERGTRMNGELASLVQAEQDRIRSEKRQAVALVESIAADFTWTTSPAARTALDELQELIDKSLEAAKPKPEPEKPAEEKKAPAPTTRKKTDAAS